MNPAASGRTWDQAASPAATRLARRFETAWRAARGNRPDPASFLPPENGERPGALLALLRADLNLRFEAQERQPLEWYQNRHPELGPEALVALIYEEFCLREEAGELVEPREYEERFPEVCLQLKRVFDIHGLVGSQGSTSFLPVQPAVPFPEVGQTIAGFRLVELLGRGAFARVFRAEERQLADRPVALKVDRTGSREPQTLARLQHTNIVPVHSYRTDPVTGLHLLCMPYLGRITLAQILAEPAVRSARSGAQLLAVLDRLSPPEPGEAGRPAGRRALARRSYAQAIAWWGAQMAEALQHAHDRGVLHRDVKPSNVLVTSDGVPMLLDFNLAREPLLEDPEAGPAAAGGTLAYMAPEHLEALTEGSTDDIDARADVYALGVVLFEALAGRPFATPPGILTMHEALARALDDRRAGVPSLRGIRPDVPPALEAVVMRALALDPADRYATAAELAADLRAVADDGPLRHAREPQPSRSLRWLRRNRRPLALAAPLVLAAAAVAFLLNKAQIDRVYEQVEIQRWIDEAKHAREQGEFDQAMFRCDSAASLAERSGFRDLYAKAREQWNLAKQTKEIRADADRLFTEAQPLRFYLLGFGGDLSAASKKLERDLGRFHVLGKNPDWTELDQVKEPLLDSARRARMIEEVNELLFIWLVASDRTSPPGDQETARRAVAICDRALRFATPTGPWQALKARFAARLDAQAPQPRLALEPAGETSARACFQWGLLSALAHRLDGAVVWLERASRLDPRHYWYQFYLAYLLEQSGKLDQALRHYSEAIVIAPDSPWARHNRAGVLRRLGAWAQALDDLQRALAGLTGPDALRARLDLGVVHQALGDARAARADYDEVIAQGSNTPLGRGARLNRAKLDYDAGLVARARKEYDALLAEDPRDAPALQGRALLALLQGQPGAAEADLDALLAERPDGAASDTKALRVQALALRALAHLALGRTIEAEADSAEAFRLEASPAHERLWQRCLLAAGRERALRVSDPDELDLWPAGGPGLRAALRAAAERLGVATAGGAESAVADALTRAVILSALGDRSAEAEAEASRAIGWDPVSSRAFLVRAAVRRRAGDLRAAWSDIEQGLRLDPADPRLLAARGALETELGRPGAGLIDIDRALRQGARGSAHRLRAQALMALRQPEQALDDWSRAVAFDPEDPRPYLGRARALLRLRRLDQALADLEQAAGWAGDHARLLLRITLAYTACLADRPDRLPRVLSLARRSWLAWVQSQGQAAPPAALPGPAIAPARGLAAKMLR